MFNELAFKKASETGTNVLLLIPKQTCDCGTNKNTDVSVIGVVGFEKNSSVGCDKCINGIIYKEMIVEKIRSEAFSVTQKGNLEKNRVEENKNDNRFFFFPKNYFFISSEHLIAEVKLDIKNNIIYDTDGKVTKINIYEISDIIEIIDCEFKAYKVSAKKIVTL